ncbi:hypothetical protein Avbf_10146, partial [Armadillidium vulgare]
MGLRRRKQVWLGISQTQVKVTSQSFPWNTQPEGITQIMKPLQDQPQYPATGSIRMADFHPDVPDSTQIQSREDENNLNSYDEYQDWPFYIYI